VNAQGTPTPDERRDAANAPRRFRPRRVLAALTVLACLPTLLAPGARWHWFLELLTHFRPHYAIVLFLCTAVSLAARKWKFAAVPAVFLAINVGIMLPCWFGRSAVAPAAAVVRGITANVHTANREPGRFLAFVREEHPHFLLVIEVNQRWLTALEPLAKDYPHRIARPSGDNFGILFLSRLPAESLEIVKLGDLGLPSVLARLRVEGRTLTVIGTHPLPPVNARCAAARNDQLRALAPLVRRNPGPLIVMGDFNMTSWSPHFRDLLRDTGLRDSARGFGIQGTWPDGGPIRPRIPIDHVLVSPGVHVHDRRVGPPVVHVPAAQAPHHVSHLALVIQAPRNRSADCASSAAPMGRMRSSKPKRVLCSARTDLPRCVPRRRKTPGMRS